MTTRRTITRWWRPHLLLLALVMVPQVVFAQVYRSVDDRGRVTFSDVPPEDAVTVEPVDIAPGPTEEQVRASQARVDSDRALVDSLREARAAEREQARETRMQRLEEQALRAAANPPASTRSEYDDSRTWRRYYGVPLYPGYPGYPGLPVRPHPKPPVHLPAPRRAESPRPKVLDSPLFNRTTSPVYR